MDHEDMLKPLGKGYGISFFNFSREHLQKLNHSKQLFLNGNFDKIDEQWVRSEILNSWFRSFKNGVNPQRSGLEYKLGSAEFNQYLENNKELINVAGIFINNFPGLKDMSDYCVAITDKNGVFLLRNNHSPLLNEACELGCIWNEETIGTNANTMCMKLNTIIQLVGPENYIDSLRMNIASAAPIRNYNNEVIGSISLAQPLSDDLNESSLKNRCLQSLILVTALSSTIEYQIKLIESNLLLDQAKSGIQSIANITKNINDTLYTTLSLTSEPMFTIDRFGNILKANEKASSILHLNTDINLNINQFLDKDSEIMPRILRGESADLLEENLYIHGKHCPFLLSFKPTWDNSNLHINGAVLRLDKNRKYYTPDKQAGARANFRFSDIIAQSQVMLKTKEMAAKFAPLQENILLIGESGTGKELFAQAIYNAYGCQGPFIAINCAAIPHNLIESELFGYESGSFTGAEKNGRPGKIELAHGGVLFLDEIGDMPYEVQATLLRVLQDKQVLRLGGKSYKTVDFRLIAASNQNIHKMSQEGSFRQDLYYRLSVLRINIPPLRARKEDIRLLTDHFIERYCSRLGLKRPLVASSVRNLFMEYGWPGNIRQLENAIIYAVNVATDDIITLEHLPEEITDFTAEAGRDNPGSAPETADDTKENRLSIYALERTAIINALNLTGNNISKAAKMLEMSKTTLYRKIRKYDIEY